ncbi:MAG: hypothetical protein ACW99U_11265 [Candidatus Thorarchaeota archaeon]
MVADVGSYMLTEKQAKTVKIATIICLILGFSIYIGFRVGADNSLLLFLISVEVVLSVFWLFYYRRLRKNQSSRTPQENTEARHGLSVPYRS